MKKSSLKLKIPYKFDGYKKTAKLELNSALKFDKHGLWIEWHCRDQKGYLHDHMFPMEKKTLAALSKYLQKLSDEL